MTVREGGWHFLPFLAYLLAGQHELGQLLGLPWSMTARLPPTDNRRPPTTPEERTGVPEPIT